MKSNNICELSRKNLHLKRSHMLHNFIVSTRATNMLFDLVHYDPKYTAFITVYCLNYNMYVLFAKYKEIISKLFYFQATHIHPNYTNSRKYDDIALLELDQEITVSQKIAPVCLYTENGDPSPDSRLFVTGWGTINLQSKIVRNTLLFLMIKTICHSSCSTPIFGYFTEG